VQWLGMNSKPPESIYQRVLREAQERRDRQQQFVAEQIQRIEQRARTHGHPQTRTEG
jgi:hypothetical protein